MSTDYNAGVYLDQVPTGFGGYTGISVFNKSDKSVAYYAEMSETSLFTTNDDPLPDTDAVDDNLYDTLFVTSDINNVDTSESSINFTLRAGESRNIYVAHKPFSTFWPTYQTTGIETANLIISSESSDGDADLPITIKVTGQRILDPLNPDKPGSFYALKSYNEEDGYNLLFKWKLLSGQAFVSGFQLDLCEDSAFSTNVADSPYRIQVPKNTESSKPDYLDYYNYETRQFEYRITDLPLQGSMYARLVAINGVDEDSDFTYCKGFDLDDINPIDNTTYKGFNPSPGSDLGFQTASLSISVPINLESEVDLMQILYDANGNSYDFTAYTGAIINFYSVSEREDGYGRIVSDTKDASPVKLKKPDGDSIIYSVDSNNKFNLILNFENIFVAGFNGEGAKWVGEEVINAENGGAIFDLDNLNYDSKIFDYYINKDKDSIFYAGFGGDPAYREKKLLSAGYDYVNGESRNNRASLYEYDVAPAFSGPRSKEYENTKGSDGKFVKESEFIFPNVYLGFSERDANVFLPNSTFLFRFKTEGISQSAGDTTDTWAASAGAAIEFKHNDQVLTVREAYGKKFYELDGNQNEDGAIQVFKNGTNKLPAFWGNAAGVDVRPNYTILVFALGRKEFLSGKGYYETIDEMLRNCNAIHKFVDSTVWGATQSDSIGFWGKPTAPFNPNNLIYNFYRGQNIFVPPDNTFTPTRSSFVGSSLNSPAYLLPTSYTDTLLSERLRVNPRDLFIYSNQMNRNADNWMNTLRVASNNQDSRIIAKHYDYRDFNLAKTENFNTGDNQKFTLSDGTELSVFELFFVKMHSTIGSYPERLIYVGDVVQGLRNETFINGIKVFDQIHALQREKYVKEMLIKLNNNDDESNDDAKTRLYLFDYMYGAASTESQRNFASDSAMEYLVSNYSNLILKSSSGRLQAAKNDGSNSQLSFGLPLSHNFLNLYSG